MAQPGSGNRARWVDGHLRPAIEADLAPKMPALVTVVVSLQTQTLSNDVPCYEGRKLW
jgi:hypothetical protein